MHDEADKELTRLYREDRRAADLVEDKLDEIEADPWAQNVTRRQLRPGKVWLVIVWLPGGDELAILWKLVRGDVVRIEYLGPNVFR
jgi:hypothetical protein